MLYVTYTFWVEYNMYMYRQDICMFVLGIILELLWMSRVKENNVNLYNNKYQLHIHVIITIKTVIIWSNVYNIITNTGVVSSIDDSVQYHGIYNKFKINYYQTTKRQWLWHNFKFSECARIQL